MLSATGGVTSGAAGEIGDVDRSGGGRVDIVVPVAAMAPHSVLECPPQPGSLQIRPLDITAVMPTPGAGTNATLVAHSCVRQKAAAAGALQFVAHSRHILKLTSSLLAVVIVGPV